MADRPDVDEPFSLYPLTGEQALRRLLGDYRRLVGGQCRPCYMAKGSTDLNVEATHCRGHPRVRRLVGVSVGTIAAPPAAADEQLALFECTDMGNGWAACETYNGDIFLMRTK
jgi:hypothetical protein